METEFLYNWDDLDVGKYDLEHSQRFFERKHLKHEKLSKDIPDLVLTMEDKENRNHLNQEDQQHKNHKNREALLDDDLSTRKAPPNLMQQPFDPSLKHKGPKGEAAPSVYKYAEVYEKKKQTMLQRLFDEEKKKRVFHSRPAPNFNGCHDQKKKSTIDKIDVRKTTPVTPKVLKKSREMEEKRKQKLEEYMKQHKAQKFIPRDAHVLHEAPFKPKKSPHVVDPQPFNLHVEKRLEERKQYDDMIKKTVQVKKKQEEEERKQREEELVRELRKLTSFKARPNPFK